MEKNLHSTIQTFDFWMRFRGNIQWNGKKMTKSEPTDIHTEINSLHDTCKFTT